ncbi:MAG: transposase [Rhodococcus sp. (in: high G+C Gram-positive bacteria)]|uniref:transposase n=1 Tax=Rhodococcus sp. TaxID=1831 RepID=UPI003BB20AD4
MRVVGLVPDADLGKYGMAKGYRPVLRDQVFLLPPDMREWLPADHLVWFLLETIEVLDTGEFDRSRRRGGVGAAGYDPRMLLGLLIYAYCRGIRSSRQIERLCATDVAFRVLCAQDVPDHCTIARFRAECQDAFTGLFTQVLMIAGRAGLGKFGTVAIDGTKIPANASIDANRGHQWLSEQVAHMIADAEQTDTAENTRVAQREHRDGERVPDRLMDQSSRARRIREAADEVATQLQRQRKDEEQRDAAARARLAKSRAGEPVVGRIPDGPHRLAEARAHLAREIDTHQSKLDRRAALIAAGKKPRGAPPVPMEEHSRIIRARRVVEAAQAAEKTASATKPDKRALPKTVANVTDPHSRLMPTRKGFLQGYNAQLAVTGDQIIAAVQITQSSNDIASFIPMMRASRCAAEMLHAETGRGEHKIGLVLADAGYCSESNLSAAGPERLIALTKTRDHAKALTQQPVTGPPPTGSTPRQAMSHRLRTPEGSSLYKRRGATVEPGIGNLKKILDRFSRRGLGSALSELNLAASAFNLMKIHRATAI